MDTNVVSELRRPERADAALLRWATAAIQTDLYISVVTLLELEIGVLRIERRNPDQGRRLRRWFQIQVVDAFEGRVLPFDVAAALYCARLHVPDKRPERDAMIGATALALQIPVATRNVADFAPMGVQVINPWEAD